MNNEQALAVFENYKIRRVYDEASETWYFSVVDVVAALIQQPDYQTARKYWNKLKERLKIEGSQLVTDCHQLKMVAVDGKMRTTDAASPETLLRVIQSVPSPRAASRRRPDWSWSRRQAEAWSQARTSFHRPGPRRGSGRNEYGAHERRETHEMKTDSTLRRAAACSMILFCRAKRGAVNDTRRKA